ncbi:chromatin accessibility complex protein 1-like [Tubulanus polymorphus]|uniref:chromatin accessibility complex protein 1-like n=1 Tax=Tubulanus polymorphus TaxID=672921 RepID=UPI003DA2E5DD
MAEKQLNTSANKSPTKPSIKPGGLLLPISRIRTIMKSSPDVTTISNDSLFLVTRAAELFIEDLAVSCMEEGDDPNNVVYNTLAKFVAEDENLQFLQDIIPQKIKAKDYIDMMKQNAELVILDSEDSS